MLIVFLLLIKLQCACFNKFLLRVSISWIFLNFWILKLITIHVYLWLLILLVNNNTSRLACESFFVFLFLCGHIRILSIKSLLFAFLNALLILSIIFIGNLCVNKLDIASLITLNRSWIIYNILTFFDLINDTVPIVSICSHLRFILLKILIIFIYLNLIWNLFALCSIHTFIFNLLYLIIYLTINLIWI